MSSGHWVTIQGEHVFIGAGGVIEKGPKSLEGKKPGELDGGGNSWKSDDYDEEINAGQIEPVNRVNDKQKFAALVEDMKENGWEGRPALVEKSGDGYKAWTASHRIIAAQKAGVKVPSVVIDRDKIEKYLDDEGEDTSQTLHQFVGNAVDDDDRLRILKKIGDVRAAKLMQVEIDANESADQKKHMSRSIYASPLSDAEAVPFSIDGTQLPATRNGIPCFYYWRTATKDGDWYNPKHRFTMHVTPEQRMQWEKNFRAMQQIGDEVPVVKDHREGDADATVGYVVDVKQDGPEYKELHQYLGEGDRDTALKNKISIGVDPNYIDPHKRALGSAIVHSAITSRPATPDEGTALQVASRGGSAQLIQMSKSDDSAPGTEPSSAGVSKTDEGEQARRPNMGTLNCSKETLDALHKHVPGLADAADDDKLARVAQHLQTMSDVDSQDSGVDAAAVQTMSRSDIHDKAVANRAEWKAAAAELATVKTEKQAAESKVLEMSRTLENSKDKELDPTVLSLMSRSLDTERDAAIAGGGVSADCAKEIDAMLRDNGKPNRLAMSRAGGSDDPAAFRIWSILRKNKPRVMGGQTGVQAMSRSDPDTGTSDTAKKLEDRMLAIANRS